MTDQTSPGSPAEQEAAWRAAAERAAQWEAAAERGVAPARRPARATPEFGRRLPGPTMAGATPGLGVAGATPGLGVAGATPGLGVAGATPGLAVAGAILALGECAAGLFAYSKFYAGFPAFSVFAVSSRAFYVLPALAAIAALAPHRYQLSARAALLGMCAPAAFGLVTQIASVPDVLQPGQTGASLLDWVRLYVLPASLGTGAALLLLVWLSRETTRGRPSWKAGLPAVIGVCCLVGLTGRAVAILAMNHYRPEYANALAAIPIGLALAWYALGVRPRKASAAVLAPFFIICAFDLIGQFPVWSITVPVTRAATVAGCATLLLGAGLAAAFARQSESGAQEADIKV